MINYGQKLQLNDLFDNEWIRQFGDISTIASSLKIAGISFVEFAIGEETDPDVLIRVAKLFTSEGLFVSLHPYLYKELSPEIFDESKKNGLKDMLNTAQMISEITGFPVPYTFHGGRAKSEPYYVELNNAIANAKKFFSYIGDMCTSTFTGVVPVCETQTPWDASYNSMVRLGDTYQSCLELIQDTDLGICWDFGHMHRSTYLGKQQELPDDFFLARVQHVHAHDTIQIGDGQEDHFPLGDGLAPWRKYCTELARYQFSDTILLEISPSRYRNLEEMVFYAKDGIERLRVYFEEELLDRDDFESFPSDE